ncbi:MAG: stage II sporulation protein M [Coriobacteriia bacterium]|nr:stage II sporulation protein M [Coriobacteriia bacterium]
MSLKIPTRRQQRAIDVSLGLWRRTRWAIGVALAVHVVGLICGIAVGVGYGSGAVFDASAQSRSAWEFFTHNLAAALPSYLGFVTLGLSAFGSLLVQSFLIGSSVGAATHTLPLGRIVLSLAPHGLIEMPGVVLAGGAGLLAPSWVVRHFRGGALLTFSDLCDLLMLFVVSVVLTGIAAMLEANVTAALIAR